MIDEYFMEDYFAQNNLNIEENSFKNFSFYIDVEDP